MAEQADSDSDFFPNVSDEEWESDDDNDVALCVAVAAASTVVLRTRKKRERTVWTMPSLLMRPEFGACTTVTDVYHTSTTEPKNYQRFMRMNEATFAVLLELVTPSIRKMDTRFRESISPKERLVVTLRYLASGMTLGDLESYHKISRSSLSHIIPETCEAIKTALVPDYLKVPGTEAEWKEVAEGFQTRWNMPHCLGAMDGKHVRIIKPANSGSLFYNYKHFFSVVLFAIVDADYKFIFVDIGANGRASDGGIYKSSGLAEAINNNNWDLPNPDIIDGIDAPLPYFFVGDDAFTLTTRLMKPYPNRELSKEKRVYNYRCSRARRISENVFGILASRFAVYQSPMKLSVGDDEDASGHVEKVIYATVALHNFLRVNKDKSYCAPGTVDTETALEHRLVNGSWRSELVEGNSNNMVGLALQGSGNAARSALDMRDRLATYFSSTAGAVPWQWKLAALGHR